ncbi:MAG TPA: DNA/RNA nuclease SfsA [Alphaproteobacteria bacterium]|nr:DNA/RNA nuclease SfsA [Alphaproteobacteria bacterium]
MKFPDPLIAGGLIKRYKRFMADVALKDGTVVTAHCANSGSMLGLTEPGALVWLSPARNPDRKLKYTWELVRVGETLVGVNTSLANKLVSEAVKAGLVPELSGYEKILSEVKYGKNSRIDFLLEGGGGPPCYVEIKSVTLKRDLSPTAPVEFPDAVTTRGTKHLRELSAMADQGRRAVMFYLVQRQDGPAFTIACDIDPDYAAALKVAMKAGVEVLCYSCKLTEREIILERPLKTRLM